MKIIIISLLGFFCMATVRLSGAGPYGKLTFNNSGATKVTNGISGQPLAAGNTFRVGLYAAPAGETNETLFTKAADTNFFAPGYFLGGTREVPPIAAGTSGQLQVRIWESAYGSSYEEAVAAGIINGRPSQLGKSEILSVTFGGEVSPPTALINCGLKPIIVSGVSFPSFSVNNILVAEGTDGAVQANFTVTLQPPAGNQTSVSFATLDGSAIAGADYLATNGTLYFAPGQTSSVFLVTLTPDAPLEADEEFFLRLTNSVNAFLLTNSVGRCLITEVRLLGLSVDVAVTFNAVVGHRYVVEFTDDFVNWSTVPGAENIIGTGSTATVYDRGGGCRPTRMYRARLLE